MTARLHGLLAEFDDPERLKAAARRVRAEGYVRIDAFSPCPVHGLDEAIGVERNAVAPIVLAGGLLGGLGGYLMQWYAAAVSYPLDVGGRPLHSWPAFIPVTFEMTVLAGAFSAVLGMLALNGLPRLHHPLFGSKRFALASRDRCFLLVEATDPKFDPIATRHLLEELTDLGVEEVPA